MIRDKKSELKSNIVNVLGFIFRNWIVFANKQQITIKKCQFHRIGWHSFA